MNLQAKLAAALAGIIFLIGSHWYAYSAGGRNHTASLKLEYAKKLNEAQSQARAKEQSLQLKIKEAQDASAKRENRLLADAANARSESVRLRDSLTSIQRQLPSLTEQAVRSYADAASVVLGECQERYTELAATADRIDNDRQTLEDAWPKE